MRILLIAYEYPPSPSPQSLRWAYLSRELACLGHEVHVLTVNLGGETPGLPAPHPDVRVHRTFAGPFRGLMAMLRERRHRTTSHVAAEKTASFDGQIKPPRSWKQTLWETLQSTAARFLFPDLRGEWKPWGQHGLKRLLTTVAPDVVISSHEPATTLELGLISRQMGFRWVADLGDPVLAGYTPPRWKERSTKLERQVCELADHIFVTNAGAAELLAQRHGRTSGVDVITQGFAPWGADHACPPPTSDRLELLYTGSFYDFRKPDALICAIETSENVRLSIAAVTVPETILNAARRMPDRIHLLGFLPHARILELQRNADVLVNIANADHSQIPGKIYEYLGACRPILHLNGGGDAIGTMIQSLQRGWSVENSCEAITCWLRDAQQAKQEYRLDTGLQLDSARVAEFSWSASARKITGVLESIPT
ncbi:glycosyltransferase [Marilutibacter chinensis]|uniref:Glycosyltransferase subfamily 4-like N-terminal domain-containing protein n=1 Tax=Marilutibacter chinensis TaxID=2912247 RepID=A0ABS9HUX3_9GAMM|nr:glycosyltransferase [Lysobacter chinensis]MCF7221972.1 hypothetical protein [Lysobacter chinensis]